MNLTTPIAGIICTFAISLSAHAVTTVPGSDLGAISGLGSDSTFATWNNLNGTALPGTGGFPGMSGWTSEFAPQVGSYNDTDSRLRKISNGTAGGGPYAASGSIYYGGFSSELNANGGTLGVGSTVPLTGLTSIIFQLQIGEAWTHDLYNDVLPVLSYTAGGTTVNNVAATYSSLYHQHDSGTVTMPTGEEPVYVNSYALQWDLSGVSGAITSFEISFVGVQHAQVYGMSLQQGNETGVGNVLPSAVPEPSSFLLAALGFAGVLRRKR